MVEAGSPFSYDADLLRELNATLERIPIATVPLHTIDLAAIADLEAEIKDTDLLTYNCLAIETQIPEPLIDVRSDPRFVAMNEFDKEGALTAELVLNVSDGLGYINLANIKNAVDFGAGSGGPTLALAQLTRHNGGSLAALESNPVSIDDLVANGIVGSDDAHQCDGIDFLNDNASSSKFDLITAFMFGPDFSGSFSEALLSASEKALNTDGRLLITSDLGTMHKVRQICDERGIDYEYMPGIPTPDGSMPTTLIASFASK